MVEPTQRNLFHVFSQTGPRETRGKRLPAALCAVTSPPRRCVLASAETLRGRQCPFPLYDASQIPLLQHRAPGPIPPAGTSLARPTKHPEARQISFFARRSLVPSLIVVFR